MGLTLIVDLYRKTGRPCLESGRFSAEIPYSPEYGMIISAIRAEAPEVFVELLVDGHEVLESDSLPTSGTKISFIICLPDRSANSFHDSLGELLRLSPQISRGEIPSDYYLIKENYYSNDEICPPKFITLSAICKLIKKLSQLAHYHDSKSSVDHFKLVFLLPDDSKKNSPTVLETKISEEMLDFPAPDLTLLNHLCSGDLSTDPHYNEKIGVFCSTLIDFIANTPSTQNPFSHLVRAWVQFIDSYQNNLGTYLSGFAFHKAKKEVAEAELQIAEQFAKVISEIAGKLLSIPVSFAVVIAVHKTNEPMEATLLIVGLLLAAIIISGAVSNQQDQLQRISHAKNVIFDSIEGKKESYPAELRTAVDEMVKNLNKNELKLGKLLWTYRVLCWIPVLAGLAIYIFSFFKIYF